MTRKDWSALVQRMSSGKDYGSQGIAMASMKYHNKAVFIDDLRFSSKLEGRCYEWLKGRSDVVWFIRQPRFDLGGQVQYVADFLAITAGGLEVIDAKGYRTAMSKTKIKIVQARYPIKVILWTGK